MKVVLNGHCWRLWGTPIITVMMDRMYSTNTPTENLKFKPSRIHNITCTVHKSPI